MLQWTGLAGPELIWQLVAGGDEPLQLRKLLFNPRLRFFWQGTRLCWEQLCRNVPELHSVSPSEPKNTLTLSCGILAMAGSALSLPPAVVARSRRILKFIQKVQKFHFSQKVALFDFSCKNSKSRTFRKKLHFSTFRAIISLFDYSGKNSKKVALFAKSRTFRLFGQFSHFSTFRAKIQKVALFAKSCTFRLFGQFSHQPEI